MKKTGRIVLVGVLVVSFGFAPEAPRAAAQEAPAYEAAPRPTRLLEAPSGLSIEVLVEEANLGGDEVELAEITFPPGSGSSGRGHGHASVEILYVLSGRLDHVVNGESHVLEAGMVGIVRPGDRVVHRVLSEGPVKALVVWAPGGEVARIAPGFEEVEKVPRSGGS